MPLYMYIHKVDSDEFTVEDVSDPKIEMPVVERSESFFDTLENFVHNNFSFILEKMPFENMSYNYYLFLAIILVLLKFILFPKKH